MHDTRSDTVELSRGSSSLIEQSSDKQDEYQVESKSILEALEVSESSSSPRLDPNIDQEKDGVTTPINNGPSAIDTLTAQDWSGPDDPDNPHNV